MGDTQDLERKVEELERKNRLLAEGLRQAERLRQIWGDSVQQLKSARAELKASRAFLDRVLAVAPDPIAVVDRRGRFVLANESTARLLGVSCERIIGTRALRWLPADERRQALFRFRRAWTDGTADFTVGGSAGTRLVFAEWSVLDSHDGKTLVLAGRDVTEQRGNRRLLKLENQILASISSDLTLPIIMETLCHGIEELLDGSLCSILLLDDEGRRLRHGAAPSLPEAYCAVIDGVEIGPQVGSCGTAAFCSRQIVVADIASDPLWAPFKDIALSHGLHACWSTPILSANGTVLGTFAIYHRAPHVPSSFDLLAASRAAHFCSLALHRKRTEEALSRSEARLQEITATLGEGVYVLDVAGRISFVNPELERLLGWTVEELIGRNGHDLFHSRKADGEPYPVEACPVHQVLRSGLAHRSHEEWFWRKDGTCIPVSIVVTPIIRDGEIVGAVSAIQDISELRRAQQAQQAAARYARSLIEASLDPLVTISPEGRITDVNQASEDITGLTRRELIGTEFVNYFTEPDMAQAGYRQVLERGSVRDYPLTIRHRNGMTRDVLYNANVYRDERGELCGVFAAARDITERKKAEQQIHRLAFYDTLTDLPNRRLLLDRLEHSLAQAKRHGWSMALLFLDLDDFKQVNDNFGHETGDQLLVAVALRLLACVRRGDTVCRQGGDEFIIVLENIDLGRAALAAEKIIGALEQSIEVKGHVLRVTASIGVAIYPGDGSEDSQELIKHADSAMYEAKRSGRNRYRIHSKRELWAALTEDEKGLMGQDAS
ncbi:PAS domain S-box protein [Methyloterricola oryzae]|uniref:PAS domain S-box protein n=1 Tax=Methyloterricola oryzae TaxID=1495050 RepID=UPI0005EAF2E1|nr:PAS domain S-box protein [Methyloterricola oryzae]